MNLPHLKISILGNFDTLHMTTLQLNKNLEDKLM